MRPTFYVKNNPVRAAGILIYRRNMDTSIEFLMINNPFDKYYEDFGGKTDKSDEYIIDTAARETREETNNILYDKMIYNLIKYNLEKIFYINTSKYVLYIVKCNEFIQNINPTIFGKIELHTGYERTIEWISKSKYFEINKNPRLCDKNIDLFIEKL